MLEILKMIVLFVEVFLSLLIIFMLTIFLMLFVSSTLPPPGSPGTAEAALPLALTASISPPPLESAPRVARYIPTTSDHHVFLLKLDKTGLSLPDPQRSSASFYWKFNSSLLKEKDFLPTFTDMWQQVAAAVITFPAGPSEWWEQLAKPSNSDFCKQFSRLVAGRRAVTRRFFTRALELALEAADWTVVAACRKRLSRVGCPLWAAGGGGGGPWPFPCCCRRSTWPLSWPHGCPHRRRPSTT